MIRHFFSIYIREMKSVKCQEQGYNCAILIKKNAESL